MNEDRLDGLEEYAKEGERNETFKTVDRELEEMIEESKIEGMLKSTQESVIDAIEAKFDEVPEDIAKEIKEK